MNPFRKWRAPKVLRSDPRPAYLEGDCPTCEALRKRHADIRANPDLSDTEISRILMAEGSAQMHVHLTKYPFNVYASNGLEWKQVPPTWDGGKPKNVAQLRHEIALCWQACDLINGQRLAEIKMIDEVLGEGGDDGK